jgi:hypothetical protein
MARVVVTAMVLWTVARVLRQYGDERRRRPALGLLVLLAVQIGLATIEPPRGHPDDLACCGIGAAVLATCLALTPARAPWACGAFIGPPRRRTAR